MTHRSDKTPTAVEGSPLPEGVFERLSAKTAGERHAELGALIAAVALHFWGGATAASSLVDLNLFVGAVRAEAISQLEATVDVEPPELPEEEPEPEPEPEQEPEPEPLEPEESPEDIPEAVDAAEPEAAPAAAEAGKVLTSEPDPDEPVDLTGEGFISGTGTRFSGGVTAKDGTSKTAVRDRAARAGGVEGARGKTEGAKGPPAVDKSRPAGLPAGANWNSCGFPPEADAEQINQARVRVVVVVGVDGKPTSVSVLSDPGYGFGRIARRCAMRFTYPVGLDKRGDPVARATRPFAITFTR